MARLSYVVRRMHCPHCDCGSEALVRRDCSTMPRCDRCGGALMRAAARAPSSPTVVDDTLWGGPRFIENLGPTPVFVATKSAYRALLAAHGMHQQVRHVPVPGTDKSPMTTSWDVGSAPGHDPRPFCMLSPPEQRVRREEAAARLGMSIDTLEKLAVIDLAVSHTVAHIASAPTSACEFIPDGNAS